MMLALWTAVTFLRLFLRAKSKAKRAMRSVLARVMILRDSTTPGTDYGRINCVCVRDRENALSKFFFHYLMFQARVFTFSVFTNDSNINIVQASRDTRDVLDKRERGVHVKILTHKDVERAVTKLGGGGEKSTLETDLVATKGSKGLLEERVIFRGQTRDIILLKFNRSIGSLKDILDTGSNFLTDTITRNKGNTANTTILLGVNLV